MRVTYISWAPHCSRSDYTARELGGTSHMIYWGWLGSHPATVWMKYLGQTFSTWKALIKDQPDVVFVMTPPPVAILAVYAYCVFRRLPYVVDAHSGVFFTKRWRLFQGLQYWLCRRALTTIVTNEFVANLVRSQGAEVTIVADVPIEFESADISVPILDEFTVVCVTSFDRDEPIDSMIEAARRLPSIPFLMTGDASLAARRVQRSLPPNLRLTGFLETAAYAALLRHAGVVIALTTDDHTMQRGAYEAIYQGTPVIVSNTEVLRRAFDQGAVHVDNSPEAITRAVLQVRDDTRSFKEGARRLRERKRERWLGTKSELLTTLRSFS